MPAQAMTPTDNLEAANGVLLVQLTAAEAENARLREALAIADQAVCDWLNLYASDMCEPGRVAEAQERVGERGTIAYISGVLQSIRAALSQEAPK